MHIKSVTRFSNWSKPDKIWAKLQIKGFKWMSSNVRVVNVEENLDFSHRLSLHLHLLRAYIPFGFYTFMDRFTPSFIWVMLLVFIIKNLL
jgi:hypothetical protein